MHPKHKTNKEPQWGKNYMAYYKKYFILHITLFKKFKIYSKCDYNNLPNTPMG